MELGAGDKEQNLPMFPFSLEGSSLFLEPHSYPSMSLNLVLRQKFLTSTLPPTLLFKSTKLNVTPWHVAIYLDRSKCSKDAAEDLAPFLVISWNT